jgi:CubicO group peptidase (beta-lactamase class C family)
LQILILATKLQINSPLAQKSSTPEDFIATVYGQPASFEPGSDFDYSNTNYLLLGEIIEQATDSTVSEQFRERITEPLGMENTFYAPEEDVPGGYVHNYADINGDGKPDDISDTFDESYQISGADGGIVTTPADLSKFARGLFKDELLAPDTLEQMVSEGQEGSDYGLGLEVLNNPQLGQDLGHTGGVTGWNAKMSYFPEQDTTVVVTQNGQASDVPSSIDVTDSLAEKVSASAN